MDATQGSVSDRLGKRAIVSQLVAALKRCCNLRDLEGGKGLHRSAVEAGLHLNKYVAATLITMYCKCGSMALAQQVFDGMSHTHRDVVIWNTLILGYVQNGESLAAMDLFTCMDCPASCITYVAALKACSGLACESSGKQEFCLERGIDIHKQIRQRGFESDMFVASSLVDMYSKCGCMIRAREVFDRMVHKDVVTWNTLLLGYVQNGEDRTAMELFSCVDCEPDFLTYVAALKACGGLASMEEGVEDQNRDEQAQQQESFLEKGMTIHKQAAQRGFDCEMFVANSLIDMYSKCRSIHHSRKVFDGMVCKDVVSWTSLILGYVRNGESLAAMDVFSAMDCEPNSVTYVAALKACQDLGALAAGRQIHARVCKLGSEVSDRVVANTLIDLYGKCGCMNRAEEVFSNIHSPDIVSWNALITGYSCCSSSSSSSSDSTCSSASTLQVFSLVKKMQEAGVQMNGVTFICILAACSHSGLVGEGKNVFDWMLSDGVRPSLKHYNCMADMLGRANRLQEAAELINKMPFGGNAVTWVTLLGACCRNKSDQQEEAEIIGKSVFDALLLASSCKRLKRNAGGGGYVLMRDLYRCLSLNRSVRYDSGLGIFFTYRANPKPKSRLRKWNSFSAPIEGPEGADRAFVVHSTNGIQCSRTTAKKQHCLKISFPRYRTAKNTLTRQALAFYAIRSRWTCTTAPSGLTKPPAAPFTARFPFEIWIIPLQCRGSKIDDLAHLPWCSIQLRSLQQSIH